LDLSSAAASAEEWKHRKVLSDHTISQRPDCALDALAESLCVMIAHLKLDDRLSILRAGDPLRSWNSLDDQRVCVVCGRKFKGRQVDIRRLPGGRYKLCCPTLGCTSAPRQWIYPTARAAGVVETNWQASVTKRRERRAPESTLRMQACRV